MATRTIIWTALPAGISVNGLPLLSVHVAPRLVPNGAQGQLQDFAEWAVWPNTTLTPWTVRFGPGSGLAVTANVVTTPAANAARWSALFAPTTLVRGRAMENFAQRKIRSYQVGNILNHLSTNYLNIAASSGDLYPDRQLLGPLINPLRPELIADALATVEQLNGAPNFTIPPGLPDATFDFAQLKRFHTPPAVRQPGPIDASQVPQFDFHQMLALAQDHPMLLRLLGLVIDLELTRFPDFAGVTTVRVFPGGVFPSGTTSVSPRTQCQIGFSTFRALPSAGNPDVGDGYLRLDDMNTFGVIAVDQDGGGLKAMDFSALIERSAQHSSIDTPTTFALPVLRARGLGVFRTGRATALHVDKFVRGVMLDANLTTGSTPGDNVLLFAEDLGQGARFDAQDVAVGIWRSLSARTGRFLFTSTNVVETVGYDEAMSNAAAGGAHDGSSDDLYLGEQIVTWNGFSLGATRPSKVINNADQLQDQQSNAHPNGFPLEITYSVAPGSLPRLRFGHSYTLRARSVDLAGNSLPLSDPSIVHGSPPVLFGRLEPVESPAVLLRTARGAGDAIERTVLRSNYNVPPSPSTAERHLAASKVSELTSELHGMFDTPAPNSMVAVSAYNLIVSREAKQFSDLPSAQPDPGGGGLSFFDVNHVRVPFLPDPVSRGALLRGVGGPTNEVAVGWDGTWPDLGSVRLVMRERGPGDPPFHYDMPNQQLDVFVAKADTLSVRLSTVPDATSILQFGLWQGLVDAGLATAALQAAVLRGRHWMFTPFRNLTLVHAVKQPLVPAEWLFLRATRQPGDTFAVLVGEASFSRKSTGRIDLDALWDEYVDDGPGAALPTRPDPSNPGAWLARPGLQAIPISAPVSPQPFLDLPPDVWNTAEVPAPGPRHEFADTKHRDVQYVTRSYSRFDEFFRKEDTIDFGSANPFLVDAAGIVHASLRLTSTISSVNGPRTASYSEGVDFSVDETTGEVTRLGGSAMPDAVDASWVPKPNDRLGGPLVTPLNVPSSARPDAPKLVYVVPTFQWRDTSMLGRRGRERIGGGVRVYLERPWWVSGGGEMLAVVMAANPPLGPQAVLPSDLGKLATQWGVDPVHAGAATPENPSVSNFPLRVLDANPRALPELPGVDFAVAGHAVGFDETRDLWYCDIDIDTGATYFPFVRLALARWQPSSLGGLDLSPVVLADYVQLAADRVATVVPQLIIGRHSKPGYNVTLTGPSYDTTLTDQKGLRAQVTVQQRVQGLPGPLAWRSVGKPVELVRSVQSGPQVTFTGTVALPNGVTAADARLLFEEFERVETDGKIKGAPQFGNRIVYADAIELG